MIPSSFTESKSKGPKDEGSSQGEAIPSNSKNQQSEDTLKGTVSKASLENGGNLAAKTESSGDVIKLDSKKTAASSAISRKPGKKSRVMAANFAQKK